MIPVEEAMRRLWAACSALPDYGGDLWSRGIARLQEKYGVQIYLSKFEPDGAAMGTLSLRPDGSQDVTFQIME